LIPRPANPLSASEMCSVGIGLVERKLGRFLSPPTFDGNVGPFRLPSSPPVFYDTAFLFLTHGRSYWGRGGECPPYVEAGASPDWARKFGFFFFWFFCFLLFFFFFFFFFLFFFLFLVLYFLTSSPADNASRSFVLGLDDGGACPRIPATFRGHFLAGFLYGDRH